METVDVTCQVPGFLFIIFAKGKLGVRLVNVSMWCFFKERGTLNLSSGVMTIKGLTLDDGGIYTAEINDRHGTPIRLIVLCKKPVRR